MSVTKSANKSNSHLAEGVRIEYPMKSFIPAQAIIYNYFSIMKDHGYVSEVVVFEKNSKFHIGVTAKLETTDNQSSLSSQ